jgi:Domain of unknown function (DUF4386)
MTARSIKTTGRIVGGLFLSAFALYGGGSVLIKAATDGATAVPENATSVAQLSTGATLVLANSAAVAGIGVLASRVLRRRARRTARIYLGTRATEAALLALAPVGTLVLVALARGGVETSDGSASAVTALARAAVESREPTYWLAMTTLGVGSVFFCRTLLASALLPRLLAVWGMVGYAVFAVGSALQLAGYQAGLPLSVPGGLFEVAAGSYLLVKGFGPGTPGDQSRGSFVKSSDLIVTGTVRDGCRTRPMSM